MNHQFCSLHLRFYFSNCNEDTIQLKFLNMSKFLTSKFYSFVMIDILILIIGIFKNLIDIMLPLYISCFVIDFHSFSSILGFSGIQRWGVRAVELYRQKHFWLDKSPDAAPSSGQWGSNLSACTDVPTPQQVLQTIHGHWWYKHYSWRMPNFW